ncbi:MAG: hypothetical protein WAL25_05780 [Acidimicrobiia bacterium]
MRPVRLARSVSLACAIVLCTAACGDNPLESIGLRSSSWINEPTVPTTIPVNTTIPTVVMADQLFWSNDAIQTSNLADRDAMLAEVFERRQGDRFVQASRLEIVTALPDVSFPSEVPTGAEWVSSQLVFESDGAVAPDPSAAFGIWSAEPYTRSRSVAQMVVLRVSTDPEGAEELASGEVVATCSRFADRSSDSCEVVAGGARDLWILDDAGGTTIIWYEAPYRYELFGRSFVPTGVLQDMSETMVPLGSIGGVPS